MADGTIRLEDFNSALKHIYGIIAASYPEDIWAIQAPDESSSLELVCNHFCTVSNASASLEYRILYNDSYAVPMLMFRGSFENGQPIPMSYFWDCFSSSSPGSFDPLSVISQTEHRHTGVPYFFVHPCQTKSLMSGVNAISPKSYLTFWLSLMACFFNIFVPTSIAMD